MLATSEGGGRLLALTTPFGKRGWFFEAWETGGESWDRTRVSAADCPRISQEFLDEELRQLGGLRHSEEYELAFLENDEGVFSTELIDAAFSNEVLPLWN